MAKGGERINMLEGHAGILRRGGAGPVTDSAWLQTSLPSEGELKAVSRLLLSREPFGDSKACVCVCVCVCVVCVVWEVGVEGNKVHSFARCKNPISMDCLRRQGHWVLP